jgi:hypothetical protein
MIAVVMPCDGGVLRSSVVVSEMDDVLLSCHTTFNETVAWSVQSTLQPNVHDLIFASEGLISKYEKTGRYSFSAGAGYYNLTIARVSVLEAGKYRCSENDEIGPMSYVDLSVNGL